MKQPTNSVVQNVTELAQPILVERNLELVDLEYAKAGRDFVLRFFIDKDGGVTLDDCAEFSHELSAILDVEDIVPNNYTLEVSSPGLDRPLKKTSDFERYAGRLIKVRTFEPFQDDAGNKRKTFLGILGGLENGAIRMTLKEGQTATIPMERVAKANLEFEL